MKRVFAIVLLTLFNLLLLQSVKAELRLPAIVSSNMVLQRNTTVELWGWADAGEKVSIKASWLKQSLETKAGPNGKWHFSVKTTDSKEPQTIEIISGTSTISLNNILFGEVWLCSGQSNMEMPVKGFNGQPVFGSLSAIANSYNPKLRLFSLDKNGAKTPLFDVEKYSAWQEATPASVSEFSAVGYYFGQQLQEILDVPVGLINTSYGASKVQSWMSTEAINRFQQVDLNDVDITDKPNHIPTALFNAMISPLIPYTIKGVIWYQGESNRMEPENYKKHFPAMVKDWRTRWGIGDFPFYYVQIAPFIYYGNNDEFESARNSAFIREAQLQCLDSIPNSGIAITLDIGDAACIHPPKKKEVADRLLFNALHQTYGFRTVDCAAPIVASRELKDGGIVLKFKHAETGLYSYNELDGFEIAGEDKIFYPAEAKILNNKQVLVQSGNVPNPVAVRYAWRNWVVGSLYDANLLPASSFRTDSWTNAVRAKQSE